MMSTPPNDVVGSRGGLSAKEHEAGRAFLSALFMAVRTAQLHDPSNKAFGTAMETLQHAANALYAATRGFSIQFVEESAFLNGTRLRFDGSVFATMRTLRGLLESRELGGIEMQSRPTVDALNKLVLFASGAARDQVSKDQLEQLDLRLLGVQRFGTAAKSVNVDRRVLAVQSYAKLILAVREQVERITGTDQRSRRRSPRLRSVRVVQDLVELCADRPDFLIRLAHNHSGASADECLCANACVLSIVMAHAIGVQRETIVDLAIAALLHRIGAMTSPAMVRAAGGRRLADASLVRVLAQGGIGRSSDTRAFIVAEQADIGLHKSEPATPPHILSRLVGVAVAYAQLIVGLSAVEGGRKDPLSAMATLTSNVGVSLDQRLVDLLINLLRAFPPGTEVLLDGGESAVVLEQSAGGRWDRPVVRVEGAKSRRLDLMTKTDGRFDERVRSTKAFLGLESAEVCTYDEENLPPGVAEVVASAMSAPAAPDLIELPADAIVEIPPDAEDEAPARAYAEPERSAALPPVRDRAPGTADVSVVGVDAMPVHRQSVEITRSKVARSPVNKGGPGMPAPVPRPSVQSIEPPPRVAAGAPPIDPAATPVAMRAPVPEPAPRAPPPDAPSAVDVPAAAPPAPTSSLRPLPSPQRRAVDVGDLAATSPRTAAHASPDALKPRNATLGGAPPLAEALADAAELELDDELELPDDEPPGDEGAGAEPARDDPRSDGLLTTDPPGDRAPPDAAPVAPLRDDEPDDAVLERAPTPISERPISTDTGAAGPSVEDKTLEFTLDPRPMTLAIESASTDVSFAPKPTPASEAPPPEHPEIDGRWKSSAGLVEALLDRGEYVLVRASDPSADVARAIWTGTQEHKHVDLDGVMRTRTYKADGSIAFETFTKRGKVVAPEVIWRKLG